MTSTDSRQIFWDQEYSKQANADVPSSKTDAPSRAVKSFIEEFNPTDRSSILDIGSGKGRNSFYLVQEAGYQKAYGIELSSIAVEFANQKAVEIEKDITFVAQNAGDHIDFPSESISLAIDMMVMHALTKTEREHLISEVLRVLKPGGYFVFYTLAAESEEAQKLIQENPGSEENSYKFDSNGHTITEKVFTKDEIEAMLQPLELIKLERQDQTTTAFGGTFNRSYYYGVFRKR